MYSELDEKSPPLPDSSDAKVEKTCVNKMDIFTIFACFLGLFVRGMAFLTIGAALPDLLQVTNSKIEQAAFVLAPWGLGSIIGILSSRCLMFLDKVVLAALFLPLLAVSTALIPISSSLVVTGVMITAQGTFAGITAVVFLVIVLERSELKHRDQFLQAEFAFKMCGAVLGPIVIRPFLSKELPSVYDDTRNQTLQGNTTTQDTQCLLNCTHQQQHLKRWTESHVLYGYVTLGALCCLPAACFFCISILEQCCKTKESRQTQEEKKPGQLCEILSNKRLTCMLVTAFLSIIFQCGSLKMYQDFITTFCVDSKADIPKAEAVLMTSVTFLAMTFGRVNAIWVSKLLTPIQMITINLLSLAVLFLALCIWAEESRVLLWISSFCVGLFFSSMLASFLSICLKHISEDPFIVGMCVGGDAIGAMIFPTIVPLLFDVTGPIVLMYLVFGGIIMSLLCFAFLCALIKQHTKTDEELVAILDKSKNTAIR